MHLSARTWDATHQQRIAQRAASNGGHTTLEPVAATVTYIDRRRGGTFRRLVADASKDALDVVLAALALLITAPVILLLALLIRLESPGGALFCQTRVGRNGRHFKCFKLRTMFSDADHRLSTLLRHDAAAHNEFATLRKLKVDPRVTRLGRVLRATSLDEVPQLWNVLRGDMSIVGPRPLVPDELDHYGERINVVLQVKPGLTGIWQVSGRNDLPYPVRVALDADYAVHRTLWSDLRIIARTVPVLLFRKGAY